MRRIALPRWLLNLPHHPQVKPNLYGLLASLFGFIILEKGLLGWLSPSLSIWIPALYPSLMVTLGVGLLLTQPRYRVLALLLFVLWTGVAAIKCYQAVPPLTAEHNLWQLMAISRHHPYFLPYLAGLMVSVGAMTLLGHHIYRQGSLQVLIATQFDHSSPSKKLGNARWANQREMLALIQGPGVIIGQLPQQTARQRATAPLLRVPLEGHALTLAPPRSGKLTASISPNLATCDGAGWPGPVVVIDPKGESFAVWAQQRQRLGHQVRLIDPFAVIDDLGKNHDLKHLLEFQSARYNPLLAIANDETMVRTIGVIVDALLPSVATHQASASQHFYQAAHRLL